MAECSQCVKPAIVKCGDLPLCIEHYLMMQQAIYLQQSMLAASLNFTRGEIEAGVGMPGLLPRLEIPRPPFIGNNLTLNNINVLGSTIGAINTGTIQSLDASITLMQNQGDSELARAVKELTEAILKSNEVDKSAKNEIADQLVFLVAQVTTKPENRSMGLVKSVLRGIKETVSVAASLLVIWDKLEPLMRAALGI